MDSLAKIVDTLAVEIGERNMHHFQALQRSRDYLSDLMGEGLREHTYAIKGRECANLEVEVPGNDEIIVIGAHYDSVLGSPGANDNATGVAATLHLLHRLRDSNHDRTLRFVAFVNEEPPYFQTERMGSFQYARACQARGDNVVGMLSLETMGYFSDQRKSQRYPFPIGLIHPDVGNFIGFVSNRRSRRLLKKVHRTFRAASDFPSRAASAPGWITGIGWSDQWSFWQHGYRGLMVTDTAPFRYAHYHTQDDLPQHIDLEALGTIVDGLEHVIRALGSPGN